MLDQTPASIFMFNFFALGLVLSVTVSGMTKGFAPASVSEAQQAYWFSGFAIIFAVSLGIAGIIYVHRKSSHVSLA